MVNTSQLLTNSTTTVPDKTISWPPYFAQNFRIPSPHNPSQSFNVYYTPAISATAPVYIFHHGAGSSGLSFAVCAGLLRDSIQCGVIAFDVRYHGRTDVGEEEEDWELGLDVLAGDEVDVVWGVARREGWVEGKWPDLILVGHRYPPPSSVVPLCPLLFSILLLYFYYAVCCHIYVLYHTIHIY
jgi:protein phosphatase methylesterase 1